MAMILLSAKTTVYLALELSSSSWLVAARLPGRDKILLHRLEAGDTSALLAFVATRRARAQARGGAQVEVVSCFEAGRDGFWLHRLLLANDVMNYIVEPTSILVNRRARRAKTDRLDAQGLLRVLAARHQGDRQICSVLRVPTPAEEDAKRPHREREHLVRERVRIENRMEALLVTQGIRKRPSLRSWKADLASLRTADGRELPPCLRAELDRLMRRLVLTKDLIREIETERASALEDAAQDETGLKIAALSRVRGVGDNFAAVLTREVFYRRFDDRRQLASYVGIAPMPHQSGSMDRDRGIGTGGSGAPEILERGRLSFSSPGYGCALSQTARSPGGFASASVRWPAAPGASRSSLWRASSWSRSGAMSKRGSCRKASRSRRRRDRRRRDADRRR